MTPLNAPAAADVLVINSQVVRGTVGGRVATFALERLGHRVWVLPTVLLPWHPGQGAGTRHVADDATFGALADDLIGSDRLPRIQAVITGYLGSPAQAQEAVRVIDAVKDANPSAIHVCDPVCGDAGGLYVPAAIAEAQRAHLLARADIATPNLFELEWLSGRTLETETEAIAAARELTPSRILVTSAPAMRRNSVSNLLVTENRAIAAEHAAAPKAPHGTGDLMTALLTANLLAGLDDETALKRSASSVFELVARSVKQGADDLLITEEQSALAQPMAMISTRRVFEPRKRA